MTDPVLRPEALRRLLGDIDIYLLDQIQRGRLRPGMRVLDAGCGGGRNSHYLLQAGFEVHAADRDEQALGAFRDRARALDVDWSDERAVVADLARLPFPDGHFDAVVCNAVLHFCASPGDQAACLDELWRVLAPGGLLWTRLASSIGLEGRTEDLGGGRHRLPDGSVRLLVGEEDLLEHTGRLGATLPDPIKTTNVQGQRCMTTWVLAKGGGGAG